MFLSSGDLEEIEEIIKNMDFTYNRIGRLCTSTNFFIICNIISGIVMFYYINMSSE